MVTKPQAARLSPDRALWRYEDLLRATTAIAGYHDIQTFRERFAEELYRVIAFDYVLVILFDPATQRAQCRMFHAPGRNDEVQLPEFEPHETPSGWVYANQEPMVIRDWRSETRYPRLQEYFRGYDIRSTCVLPLTTVHRRLGVFAIGVSRPDAFSRGGPVSLPHGRPSRARHR